MRKYALVVLLALAGTLTLAACSNEADNASPQQDQVQQVTRPTDPNDSAAWGKYLGQVLSQHLQGMTADRPYPYLVPAGASSAAQAQRARQLDSVTGVVLRGVTPGNLLAFGGPSSSETADLVVAAFKQASPGSMKGVIVEFIGDKADSDRVAAAVKPSGATYRFIEM
ncbi:MAG TPA: hypothetical protein VFG67_08785 [Oleiagrimonas sp.]|nr:hypothetical protein [Oleiagrimonas sp.]